MKSLQMLSHILLVVVAQAPADEVDAFLKSYREARTT